MTSSLFTHQRHAFNNQFRFHFGDAFQDWFSKLASLLHPNGHAQSVRLTQGDGKLDVLVLNEQLVYQCYAPQTFRPSETVAKIRADFHGASQHLDEKLKKWVFVHNHPTGSLDKDSLKALNDLAEDCQTKGASVEILAWGIEELWHALESNVPYSALRELFGPADPVHVDYACLEELLNTLERAAYNIDAEPVSRPNIDKLEFNDLGTAYRREIREGWNGLRTMDGYLASRAATDPEFGERLAQRFRKRYQRLRSRPSLTSDEIYESLRLDAGWKASPDVKREMAVRIILAYFFDSCDIFENPPSSP